MSYYNNIKKSLNVLCGECNDSGSGCSKYKCNVGFAKHVIEFAEQNIAQIIPDGVKMVPREDYKYYDEIHLAEAIANICKLCKQCKENHNEECIISLCRRSLEVSVLKENIEYKGSIVAYLIEVTQQKPMFGKAIKESYERLE